jgi:hypothetical protein
MIRPSEANEPIFTAFNIFAVQQLKENHNILTPHRAPKSLRLLGRPRWPIMVELYAHKWKGRLSNAVRPKL